MTPRAVTALKPALENSEEFIEPRGESGTAVLELQRPHADVLGIQVDAVDMTRTLARIQNALVNYRKGYICMAGVHGIMEAQRNPALRETFADAYMVLPDGMPTVWVGHWQGLQWIRRVTGPDLMIEIFRREEFSGYRHFFYGGKPGVAQELSANLSRQFPWARVVGTYTPPFRELTLAEERQFLSRIRKMRPSIIWVGISTPRQEMFMRKYLPALDTTLMFGVGAAFDFHTGRIKDCADWIKRAGLQWLHRLIQDPRHLLWRYLRNNPAFLWRIGLQLSGLRTSAIPGPASGLAENEQLLHGNRPDLYTRGRVELG